MPRQSPRYGSARDASGLLGLRSTSQLNAIRNRSMLEYDPVLGTTSPVPDGEGMMAIYRAEVGPVPAGTARRDVVQEHYLRTRYLVCPALCAIKLPGAAWRYNLDALAEVLAQGPPGARFRLVG